MLGQKQPGALGRPGGPASVLLKRHDKYVPGLYQAYTFEYTWYIQRLSKTCFMWDDLMFLKVFTLVLCPRVHNIQQIDV